MRAEPRYSWTNESGPGRDLWSGESSAPDVDITDRPVTRVAAVQSDLIQQGDVGRTVTVAAIARVVSSLELELIIQENSEGALVKGLSTSLVLYGIRENIMGPFRTWKQTILMS